MKVKRAKTVNQLINKSNVSELLEEIDNDEVKDIGIVYRNTKGEICCRWVGDTLALLGMIGFLKVDMTGSLGECQCEPEED